MFAPELRQPPVIQHDQPDQFQAHGEVDIVEWPELSKTPGRRLGTHRDLDRRRHQFAVETTAGWLFPPQDIMWPRHVPIFDQGNCAGAPAFAIVGALGSEPQLRAEMRQTPVQQPPPLPPTTLFDIRAAQFTADLAMSIYGQATHLDSIGAPDNVWPKNDPGTTGDAVCQVVRNMGLITGWGHCLGATSVPHALQVYGPVLLGLPWFDRMSTPDESGEVRPVGTDIVGGNMLLCREYQHGPDEDSSWFWLDGQWGSQWGVDGRCRLSAATLRQLYNAGAHGIVLKTGNPKA